MQALIGGRAVLLHYTATLEDGSVAHAEATLLATGANGALTLWPVMSELPFVLAHAALPAAGARSVVFASGPRDAADTFREEITIALQPDGSLLYAHAWGLPGGDFADRSACRMTPQMTPDRTPGMTPETAPQPAPGDGAATATTTPP